jgi:hypothetical protein
MTFHQYLGIPGLGIGVGPNGRPEEILFLSPTALEILATSTAGEKERKLPALLLKYLRLEKREFVRDWMRGYVNLEQDEEEFIFSVDADRVGEKAISIEYLGIFDGSGGVVGHRIGCGKCGDTVVEVVPVSRVDVVM